MDTAWRNYIERFGATIFRDRISHYGDLNQELINTEHSDIMVDLSHKGLIQITGEQAETFLQGQLTCNMHDIDEHNSRLGAHCNPKGRMLNIFRAFKRNGDYYLFIPRSISVAAIAQLQKYAIFSKVDIKACPQLLNIGLSGPHITDLLQTYFNDAIPSELNQVCHQGKTTLINILGPLPRYLIIAPREELEPLWDCLMPQLNLGGADCWQLLNIDAGIPSIYPATIGRFTAHQVNYPTIGGVSFNKGCYTGQEVVARMQHLGKLKSHMYRAYINSPSIPRPGQQLFAEHRGQTIDVGDIVIAKPDPFGGYRCLAVVKDDFVRDNTCYLQHCPQSFLRFLSLPYDIKQRKNSK